MRKQLTPWTSGYKDFDMNTDRIITVELNENPRTKYEKAHPIEIRGMGVVVVDQKFCISIKEANLLCDKLTKITCLASLKAGADSSLPIIPSEPNPYTQPTKDIYVKSGPVDTARDGGTLRYKGWDGKDYFVDYRISTNTKGKIYDRYPSEKGAILLTDARLIQTDVPPDPPEFVKMNYFNT